jgi:hypothetical protein
MFYADPAAALRKLTRHLRAGGLLVFHESDWAGARSLPAAPTYDRCCRWVAETFGRLGTEARMGIKLHAAFVAAGLPAPAMRLDAIIGGPAGGSGWLGVLADIIGALLPEIERLGIASAAEVGIETLAERLRAELAAGGGTIASPSVIGAWSST